MQSVRDIIRPTFTANYIMCEPGYMTMQYGDICVDLKCDNYQQIINMTNPCRTINVLTYHAVMDDIG